MGEARRTEILENVIGPDDKSLIIMSLADKFLRSGQAYEASFTTSVAQSGSFKTSFLTPEDELIYIQGIVVSSTAAVVKVELYENVTSSAGTAFTPTNLNRNSANISSVTVKTGVTADVTSVTPLETFCVGAGSANTVSGLNGDSLQLKKNTEYILVVTELGVAATQVDVDIRWHEE